MTADSRPGCAPPLIILEILLLLLLANGAPVIASKLLGRSFDLPLDGGARFFDGRPLFGRSKTLRGIVFAVPATAAGALLLGYTAQTGMLFALASLCGDLVSSFVKRRLDIPPSGRAIGLDQLPESILPLIACRHAFDLDWSVAAAVVAIFLVGDLLLSRILFRLHIRKRPY